MAGNAFTPTDLQYRAGAVAQELWDKLQQARAWYLWLNDATHTNTAFGQAPFNAAPYNFTANDVTNLASVRTAAADLGGDAGLWAVARNLAHPAANNDFFFTAKTLTGLNWSGTAT